MKKLLCGHKDARSEGLAVGSMKKKV